MLSPEAEEIEKQRGYCSMSLDSGCDILAFTEVQGIYLYARSAGVRKRLR